MADDSKISPYNIADCKNTTDDALQNYLNSLKIQQSHFYTDVKLALGYAGVIISAACFTWDYKLGFEQTKLWTTAAVVLYFALNGAFTYWIMFVEKDVIFTGDWNGRSLVVSTKTKKFDPMYRLTARYTASTSSKEIKEVHIEAPFMNWFTADGHFVAQPFQQWLASTIPVIGEADPKTLANRGSQGNVQEKTVEPGSFTATLDGLATGTKVESGGKRRKG